MLSLIISTPPVHNNMSSLMLLNLIFGGITKEKEN